MDAEDHWMQSRCALPAESDISPSLLGSIAALAVAGDDPAAARPPGRGRDRGLSDRLDRVWIWLAGAAFAGSLVPSAPRLALGARRAAAASTTRPDAAARYGTGIARQRPRAGAARNRRRASLSSPASLPNDGRHLDGRRGRRPRSARVRGSGSLRAHPGARHRRAPAWPIAHCCSAARRGRAWRPARARDRAREHRVRAPPRRVPRPRPLPASLPRRCIGWIGARDGARIAAATAIAARFRSRPAARSQRCCSFPRSSSPACCPLTPGNVGVASAAVALRAQGARRRRGRSPCRPGSPSAPSRRSTTLAFGCRQPALPRRRSAGAVRLARPRRRAMGCLALAAAFGVTVIFPVV